MNTIASLEKKLNTIIDTEFEKEQPDDNTVMFCAYALLRMDNTEKYLLSRNEYISLRQALIKKTNTHKISKKVKIILIAAAIILLAVITAVAYGQRDYIIEFFGDHSVVSTEKTHGKLKKGLTIDYIPDGFKLTNQEKSNFIAINEYSNADYFFNISKEVNYSDYYINSEGLVTEEITIGNITYIIVCDSIKGGTVMWFDDNIAYVIYGNISEEELLKIATNVR